MSTEQDEPPADSTVGPAANADVDPHDDTLADNDAEAAGDGLAPDDPDRTPAATLDPVVKFQMGDVLGKILGAAGLPDDIPTNVRLGSYRLERKLGAGGMGEVFAARHVETGETFALKTLSSTTATRLYRFKREFRALADVSHRNLIRLHEMVVPEEGPAFFTMELLEGRPFVDWVRGSAPVGELPDLGRLEESLRQLVEGVQCLHIHGCIHRDLKPANVLVTTEGRVVILDFGLVSELSEPDKGITRDKQIMGTPSYMAPEQALGDRVGSAADYYAIGVMLFESLTGRLPHQGAALVQLVAKQDTTVDPGVDVAGMPEWLRSLCVRLLARDPKARPGGRELLEQLRAPSASEAGSATVFVGRKEELRKLHAALGEVDERKGCVTVHLRGRSGDGKSALVRQFRSELRRTDAVVLHGRCREQETVPYKGVDAIVDALSAYLRRLPSDERTELRPPDLDALVRVFPVLDEIWVGSEPQHLGLSEVRKLGGVTLRKLLRRLADKHPLVVHIDDFQWADLDSVSLLGALARPPQAPEMLLLLSYRSEAEGSEALRELSNNDTLASEARTIELGPLSASDARELASSLLPADDDFDPGRQHARSEAIALRSRGSPFFITQMAIGGGDLQSNSELDQIVVRRLAKLDRDARRLLDVVAVFGGPLSVAVARELCGASEAVVGSLCEMGLLVQDDPVDGAPDGRIEAAHDRVREAVLAALDPDEQVGLHRELGERLLARWNGVPKGDAIFAVVDHLIAAHSDLDALSRERRLQLARLGEQAGQRALEPGAWASARRYFCFAYALLEPWLEEARGGHGEHTLCVAVAFGRAQAESTLDEVSSDALVEKLLGWSLSTSEYCRIAQWYSLNLSLTARFAEGVEFGMKALAHLGFRVPRRPSLPMALLSYARGWRAIWRADLEDLRSSPSIADDRLRTGMEILGVTAGGAGVIDIKLRLALIGTYCRLLAKHGFHDSACITLSVLTMTAATRGKHQEVLALCKLIQDLLEHRRMSKFAQHGAQGVLLQVLPVIRPMQDVLASGERVHSRARELAPRVQVELIGVAHANNCLCASVPLSSFAHFLDSIEIGRDGFMLAWVAESITFFRRYVRSLIEGRTELPISVDLLSHRENPQLVAIMTIVETQLALLVGDSDRAWDFMREVPDDHELVIGHSWHVPAHAVFSVIAMAERWPDGGRRERRKLEKVMRKREATARRWAKRCPENYQPMLDIIRGERAALEDRYDDAVTAYELARSVASEQDAHRLVGLSSERLAKLARRRGHTILADGAFDAAREAYEAWGATAVVRRLDRERTAGSPAEDRLVPEGT